MLILKRRMGEKLRVGRDGELTFTILDVKNNVVRVGIDAPKSVVILRDEVFQRQLEERYLQSIGNKDLQLLQTVEIANALLG